MSKQAVNRSIKFRAWNFKSKTMFSAEEMTKDQMALLPNGFFANIDGQDTTRSIIYTYDQMIPMQFTGYYDANGKEIYEGDIILDDTDGQSYDVIEWDQSLGGWTTHIWYSPKELAENCKGHEVAGNIYENPELLNG